MKIKEITFAGVVKTATAVGDGVIEGTKVSVLLFCPARSLTFPSLQVVGSGIVDVTEKTAAGVKAVGSATVDTVNATVDETASFVREKKRSVNRHMRRTVSYVAQEGDTLGIIAAKYKTTCEDLIELNPQLADRTVQQGEELRVPVGGSRKMSRTKENSSTFLQGLSLSFLEEDDMAEGVDLTETRCLMLSNAEYGPSHVTQGYLILDSTTLTLSWAREDPLAMEADNILAMALLYGPVELQEFSSLVERSDSAVGHSQSLSESAEVFPVYDEEQELELDSSYGTDDHSPHLLHTQDSGNYRELFYPKL